MNCEQYRAAIAAEPSFEGGSEHLEHCDGCRSYRREMLELDDAIRRALTIDVPVMKLPELPEEDTVVVELASRRRPVTAVLAIAATVVLAAFLGVRMIGSGSHYDSLADELLAHLDHDPSALRVTDVAVSDERLAAVVPSNLAELDRETGLITYAQTCVVNGRDVPHLVMQGQRGPVTIILMPHEKVPAAQSVDGVNVKGIILPVGDGSIAIFGAQDEPFERIEKQILDSVTWDI